MRGLKLLVNLFLLLLRQSHLLQMRGLKQDRFEPEENLFVASFTDAWIETHHLLCNLPLKVVASFTDAWIETLPHSNNRNTDWSHLLQMRGLKHSKNHPF